jgi:hypothetical protein
LTLAAGPIVVQRQSPLAKAASALPRQKCSRIMTVASRELLPHREPGGGRDEAGEHGDEGRVSCSDKRAVPGERAGGEVPHRRRVCGGDRLSSQARDARASSGPSSKRSAPRPLRRIYRAAEREALIVLWEASDRVCGKRLKAIIPTLIEAMVRHGHLALAPEVRTALMKMSAATIDRVLQPQRERCSTRRRPIATFVSGLRTAWQDGEVRPTSKPKPKAKRGARRPDPLVTVTEELRAWFDADPTSTGSQLLDRLQETYPGSYPDSLISTVQRRLKIWRREIAVALVFGRAGQGASSELPPNRTGQTPMP